MTLRERAESIMADGLGERLLADQRHVWDAWVGVIEAALRQVRREALEEAARVAGDCEGKLEAVQRILGVKDADA